MKKFLLSNNNFNSKAKENKKRNADSNSSASGSGSGTSFSTNSTNSLRSKSQKKKTNRNLFGRLCSSQYDNLEEEEEIDDPDPLPGTSRSNSHQSVTSSITRLSNILQSKTKKDHSIARRFFDAVTKNQVKCKLCGGLYKTSGNTSNMFDHLMRKHEKEISQLENGESESTEGDSITSCSLNSVSHIPGSIKNYLVDPYPSNSEKKKKIDQKLGLMIAIDFQPLSIVKNEGFKSFVAELNPRYNLISRKTLTTKILPQCWEISVIALKKKLEKCERGMALTMDAWTSSQNQSYLGITVHFVDMETKSLVSAALDTVPILTDEKSETIKTIVTEVLNEWNINGKIQCIVTDNAPNMMKAADLLKIRHLPCFAHTLNLVIKNSIKAESASGIQKLITTCKNIVTFFHCSPKASRLLRAKKKEHCEEESEPPDLVQYIEVRWNTVYYMLRSIITNFKFLQLVKLEEEYADLILPTKDEIKIIEEILQILQPFDEITKTVSAEKYVTISLIIPSVHGLQRKLNSLSNQLSTTDAKEFLSIIIKFVQEKLFFYEQRTASRIATLLDPRFKKQAFMTDFNCQEAISICQNFLNIEMKKKQSAISTAPATSSDTSTENNMFDFLKFNVPNTTSVVSSILLLKNYLDRKPINLNEDPIVFWLQGDLADSVIAEVAMDFLCIPATSVPVERLFSHSGYIATDRRNCLKPKNVQMLTFLNINHKFCKSSFL